MEIDGVYGNKRMAPQVGLEPTTLRLTAGCSAIELLRSGETAIHNNIAGRGSKTFDRPSTGGALGVTGLRAWNCGPAPLGDKLISGFFRQVDQRRRGGLLLEASDPGGSRNGSTEMRS
jgi:hypothetical protein